MSNTSLPESPAILKRCIRCGVEKPVTAFSKQSSRKDGLHLWCKACAASHSVAYYQTNREKLAANRSAYRKANPDKVAASEAAYRKANREKVAAIQAAYYKANREKLAASKAAYRKANKDKIAAYRIAYHAAHKEEANAYNAAYQRTNPEKIRASNHLYRARKYSALGTHTAQQVQDLLKRQRGKCVYCKTNVRKNYHVDHIIALANGGSNDITNIQLLCPTCNCSKRSKDPIEFAQQKGLLL